MIAGVLATGGAGAVVMGKSWLGKLKGKKANEAVAEEAPSDTTNDEADAEA